MLKWRWQCRNCKVSVQARQPSEGKQEVAGDEEGVAAAVDAAGAQGDTPFWKSWRIW